MYMEHSQSLNTWFYPYFQYERIELPCADLLNVAKKDVDRNEYVLSKNPENDIFFLYKEFQFDFE